MNVPIEAPAKRDLEAVAVARGLSLNRLIEDMSEGLLTAPESTTSPTPPPVVKPQLGLREYLALSRRPSAFAATDVALPSDAAWPSTAASAVPGARMPANHGGDEAEADRSRARPRCKAHRALQQRLLRDLQLWHDAPRRGRVALHERLHTRAEAPGHGVY